MTRYILTLFLFTLALHSYGQAQTSDVSCLFGELVVVDPIPEHQVLSGVKSGNIGAVKTLLLKGSSDVDTFVSSQLRSLDGVMTWFWLREFAYARYDTPDVAEIFCHMVIMELGYCSLLLQIEDHYFAFYSTNPLNHNYRLTVTNNTYYTDFRRDASDFEWIDVSLNSENIVSKCKSLEFTKWQDFPVDSIKITDSIKIGEAFIPITFYADRTILDLIERIPKYSNYCKYIDGLNSTLFLESISRSFKMAFVEAHTEERITALLKYCQSFEYRDDQSIYNRNLLLSPEQIYFYEYSDCDDRAILFSFLFREIIGSEIVLVEYSQPGHLNVGVSKSYLPGYSGTSIITYNDKEYVIVDPTSKGSGFGWINPLLDSSTAEVIVCSSLSN